MSDIFPEATEGKPDGKQPLHFYYNRQERLENAPQIVKDYYDGKMEPVRGIKIFFSKQNRFILIALVFFVAFTWMYNGFNKTRNYAKIQNLVCELTAFKYDGEVYTNIKISDKKNTNVKEPKKISAEVFFVNNDNVVLEKKELSLLYKGPEEYLRTKMTDYDIIRVDVILTVDDEEKELSSVVSQ